MEWRNDQWRKLKRQKNICFEGYWKDFRTALPDCAFWGAFPTLRKTDMFVGRITQQNTHEFRSVDMKREKKQFCCVAHFPDCNTMDLNAIVTFFVCLVFVLCTRGKLSPSFNPQNMNFLFSFFLIWMTQHFLLLTLFTLKLIWSTLKNKSKRWQSKSALPVSHYILRTTPIKTIFCLLWSPFFTLWRPQGLTSLRGHSLSSVSHFAWRSCLYDPQQMDIYNTLVL